MSGSYHDEPIPKRGSGPRDQARGYRQRSSGHSSWTFISEEELFGRRSGAERRIPEGDMPKEFRKLLEMTRTYETDEEKRTEAFLEQAAFMAQYEDEYRMRGVPVRHIFVAYQELQADELRGYFAWRTRIRAGETAWGGRDYLRLHAAELINLVGVSSPGEAFDSLLRLQALAGASDRLMADTSMKNVLRDFIIAHGLDQDLALAYCIEDPEEERAKLGLAFADTADDYTLYAAIRKLVGEQIDGSRFLPGIREDACHVIARSVRRLSARERAQKGKGILERLLGPKRKKPCTMFAWLPFRTSQPDGYLYEVDPVLAYEYSQGTWYCHSYSSYRDPDEIRNLSGIVRECERLLRKAFHYKNALPSRRKDPQTEALIGSVIEEWLKEKAMRARPEVKIDLTKLSGIRAAADITRERLLEGTEEETDFTAAINSAWPEPAAAMNSAQPESDADLVAAMSTAQPESAADLAAAVSPATGPAITLPPQRADEAEDSSVFSPEETQFLRLLLDEKPWKEFISSRRLMLSVFVDGINEKAYDLLGDTILEIEDGVPVLISDYCEDVKEMVR